MSRDFFDRDDDRRKHRKHDRDDDDRRCDDRRDRDDRCDDPCDRDDCKKKKKHKKEDERGLLTEFQVDQMPFPVPAPGVPALGNQFTSVRVCTDDRDDRVALNVTVEWVPDSLTVTDALIALLTTGIILGVPAVFRIWRRSSEGTVLVSEKTDTSPIFALAIPLVVGEPIVFANTTTTIHAVDTDPDKGKNEYFITIELDQTVIPDDILSGLLGIPGALPALDPSNVVSYTFSASEIEDNDD